MADPYGDVSPGTGKVLNVAEGAHKRGRMGRLPSRERPRERLLREGPRALSEMELLALVLGSGSVGRDVLELAESLLALAPGAGVRGLARLPAESFREVEGIGPARAAALGAAFELGRRAGAFAAPVQVRSEVDLLRIVAPVFEALDHEEFWVVCLGVHGEVISHRRVGLGGVSRTPADLRSILREAVRQGASAVAVAHNHPSGDPRPSDADTHLTQALVDAGEVLGIPLFDHIIVGEKASYSFRVDGGAARAGG